MKKLLLSFIFSLLMISTLFAQEEIFTIVEEMPRFPGCEEETDKRARKNCADKKLLEFISENVQYPKKAIANGVEGVVVIKFYVDTDGTVKDLEILRDIGAGCGKAAYNVINKMNEMEEKWIPGRQRGKKVKVYFNMPINFKLSAPEQGVVEEKEPPPPPPTRKKKEVEEIFTVVEEMPRFPGCEDETSRQERSKCTDTKLLSFIHRNLEYPKKAIKNKVEGLIVVRFYVDTDGTLKDFKVIKSVDEDCDKAALEVAKKMNEMEEKWIPGRQRGKKVKVYFNMVVRFKL